MEKKEEYVKKKMTLIVNHPWNDVFEGKDVFLVPCYIGKIYHYDVKIVFPSNYLYEAKTIRDVELVPVSYIKKLRPFSFVFGFKLMRYLFCNARKIDLFMRFHVTITTAIMIIIYKMLNRNGIAYIKLDSNGVMNFEYKNNLKSLFRKLLYRRMFELVDFVSYETKMGLENITQQTIGIDISSKLFYMPNGFDEDMIKHLDINVKEYSDKENVMITVGRLGTNQKNTELFLKAVENIDLKDWVIYLIGDIDPQNITFLEFVSNFFSNHPEKKKSVIFTGAISDKRHLWEYYNKSKVFVLTSRCESYGLVLNEAKRFRNFIVSTNVGAFEDLVESGKYGCEIPQDNTDYLACILEKIILGQLDIDVYNDFSPESLSYYYQIKRMKLNN